MAQNGIYVTDIVGTILELEKALVHCYSTVPRDYVYTFPAVKARARMLLVMSLNDCCIGQTIPIKGRESGPQKREPRPDTHPSLDG